MTLTLKNCTARIVIRFQTPLHARAVYLAMEPETRSIDSGSHPSLTIRSNIVSFELESGDLAAVRASLNSFVRLADSAYRCLKASEGRGRRRRAPQA